MKRCKCHEKLDALLEKQGSQLVLSLSLKGEDERCVVATQRMPTSFHNGKLLANLVANYCPFCGQKYPEKLAKIVETPKKRKRTSK